jgi:hypothetical protein
MLNSTAVLRAECFLLKCNYGENLLCVIRTLKYEGYLTVIQIKFYLFKEF